METLIFWAAGIFGFCIGTWHGRALEIHDLKEELARYDSGAWWLVLKRRYGIGK